MNFNKIRFTLFTWCLLASCVIIFPIRWDLSDFLYPATDLENNRTGSKMTPSKQQHKAYFIENSCEFLSSRIIVIRGDWL